MNTDHQPDSLTPPTLEQLGALCSLLLHELANHMCVISGNATFAQLSLNDPERLAAAIQAVIKGSETAAHVLGNFGQLRHGFADQLPRGDAATIVELLRDLQARRPAWSLHVDGALSGPVSVPSCWVAFAAQQVIVDTAVERGDIHIRSVASDQTPIPLPPGRRFIEIRLAYESKKAFSIRETRAECENLGLLASFELIRNCGGKLEGLTPAPARQEALIFVPFAAVEA